jgi:hypothetical protein
MEANLSGSEDSQVDYFDHLAVLDKERYVRGTHLWKLKKEGKADCFCCSTLSRLDAGGRALPQAPGFNVPTIAKYHIKRQHQQQRHLPHPVTPASVIEIPWQRYQNAAEDQ